MRGQLVFLVLAAAAAALALLGWPGDEPTVVRAAAATTETVTPAPAPPGSRSATEAAPRILSVSVQRSDGGPQAATFAWQFLQPPLAGGRLAPEPVEGQPPPTPEPQLRLPVPAKRWTWLRVDALAPEPATAYALVLPFEGTHDEIVRLTAGQRRLHVFVLDHTLQAAVAGGRVRLWDRAAADPVAEQTTDAAGRARFADLAPGVYTVTAPGAARDARPPHGQPIVVAAGSAHTETCCTVVAPARRHPVRLAVHATINESLRPPLLYLRPLRPGAAPLTPFLPPLRDADQQLEVQVPAGDYLLECLPQGAVTLAPDPGVLQVPVHTDAPLVLRAREAAATTELALRGLTPLDLPLQVHAHPDGAAWSGEELLFLGPSAWHVATHAVPPLAGPVRLVAHGRRGPLVSRRPVDLHAARVEAELEPAAQIHVRWFTDLASTPEPVVEIRHAQRTEILVPQPGLDPESGELGLFGWAILPAGPCTVTARAAGETRWTGTTTARTRIEHVVVDAR